jgi:hypothetical protein
MPVILRQDDYNLWLGLRINSSSEETHEHHTDVFVDRA